MTAVHLSRIDLNLLVVLETIHAEGGITRAAEKLHLTQPAISHALARLRETFDDPLFVRQGNAMVPTPLARRLIGPVGDALRTLDATFGGLERFDPATSSKRFAIGLRAVMESTVLPSLVQAALAQAPGVELSAVRVDRRRVESDLASGVLDVAIDVLLPVSESVRHARLSSDRMVVVARRGHPQDRRRRSTSTPTSPSITCSSRRGAAASASRTSRCRASGISAACGCAASSTSRHAGSCSAPISS